MFGRKRNMHKKQQSFSPTNIFEMIFFLTKHSSSSSTTTLTWAGVNLSGTKSTWDTVPPSED